ncbi:phosphoenolpyruvate--protein phosphotransferase [Ktedonosporobacter rubrisoli]|uniref:Phosphoenolpyruvate-protein phosphotransferase n=1 Tax=Ktedonosporobacter rubrisoli TaxID=2509675 RepID=A0A4P6JSZ1_KTERU|nr:phosphoenolpyruvate--protein phosphotransferase [Ktedonosporobacter rubrisoli]QBD78534.1 phosphoenolpyruvate--protein phosphotransferase [Ktedonosporobacter rubrisoli]
MTIALRGTPAASGVAVGSYILYDPTPPLISHEQLVPEAVAAEKERLDRAIQASKQEITQLRDQVSERLGKEEAAIFDAHLLILEDEALLESAYQRIEDGLMNAEQALWEAADEFAQLLANLSDSYFQARATDIYDIRTRVICHLQGKPVPQLRHLQHPAIIVARDLLPSDTAGLDAQLVLGLATEQGGPTSHTAILARQLGIPAVVGATGLLEKLRQENIASARVALDGSSGEVVIDPDEATVVQYQTALEQYRKLQQELQALRTLPAVTPDGVKVEVAANIGRSKDALPAVEAGANGVGLFRTEFLFLDRTTPPSEEEQFEAYSTVLKAFAGKTVIVRTLDIGGDKSIPYLSLEHEDNPFLGLRGIRLCLAEKHQPLFRTQVRALLRAAEHNPASLWIMYPMICDSRELRQARAFVAETEAMLLAEGILKNPVSNKIRQGIMIETPAAALLVDVLSKDADFFSIGTNDLSQYTLASDRMNANLVELHRPFHPAVMRSIAQIITTAHKYNRWIGMCGEMAGNPRACKFLLGVGLDEFSMEVNSLNAVKQIIRSTTRGEAQEIVQRVLAAESADEIEQILL